MDHIDNAYRAAEKTVDGIGRGGAIKPKRSDTKPVPQEKPKPEGRKPGGKKTVVPRRAPARGKYIDEYASPPG